MSHPTGILIEAEDFDSHGGWVVDSQFETQMGSPYLLAHGLGRPVADATTVVAVAEAGDYVLRAQGNDSTGDGGGGFQCCWTNAHVKVTVKAAQTSGGF